LKANQFICSPGIWSFGNYSIDEYTGMTHECEATLNALDVRIKEFEEKNNAGKVG
jgi:hypothetical protein